MNTLQPFYDELEDLQLIIDIQARCMERDANNRLRKMARGLLDWSYSYAEQAALYNRWKQEPGRIAVYHEGDTPPTPTAFVWPPVHNEPWHYEYPFKGPWYRRVGLYLKGLFTGNWRVR